MPRAFSCPRFMLFNPCIRFSLLLTIAFCTLFVSPSSGQVNDAAKRWANVSGWKGVVSISGNGSGNNPTRCSGGTDQYSNNQTLSGMPVLQGAFPDWLGPSDSEVSLSITDHEHCPEPFESDCLQTVTGMGNGPLDILAIEIDANGGKYTVTKSAIPIVVTGCDGTVTNDLYPLGPLYGPDGTLAVGTLGGQIPLPPRGVVLEKTIPTFTDTASFFAIPWNISFRFAPVCKLDNSKLVKRLQGGGNWGRNLYDATFSQMSSLGCAATALSMAEAYAGVTNLANGAANDPGSLNTFMQSTGDYSGTSVNWDPAVRDSSRGTSKFNTLGGKRNSATDPAGAKEILDVALCGADPHPVIVGVTGLDGKSYPGHYVLVTGKDGDVYDILDPAGMGTTLDDYSNKFETRGSVVAAVDPPDQSIGSLDIIADNVASLLVADANNKQTGAIASTGQVVQNIPGSAYFADSIADDVTGAAPTQTGHAVEIFAPADGKFTITVIGATNGAFHLSIRAFARDGSPEPSIVLSGHSLPGSVSTYSVNYVSALGASTTASSILPGDLNGDGVVNCADLTLVKASFGKKLGQPGFDPRADVNGDGVVNVLDLSAVARQIPPGTTCH